MDNEKKPTTIQTVDRAFQILEIISARGPLNLGDLHAEIKVNKASLLRLLQTLTENGYLERNEQTKEYALTLRLYETGISAVQRQDRSSIINTMLTRLSQETGRIAQYSIEDNNELLCIQSIGPEGPAFSFYTNAGTRSPLYCTSAGKAILASYSNAQIMEKWETLNVRPLTEHTITDVHRLLADVSQIRSRQYALDLEENEYGVFCIGAIVRERSGQIGAVSISGKTMTEAEEAQLSEKLLPTVRLLSGMLGSP